MATLKAKATANSNQFVTLPFDHIVENDMRPTSTNTISIAPVDTESSVPVPNDPTVVPEMASKNTSENHLDEKLTNWIIILCSLCCINILFSLYVCILLNLNINHINQIVNKK